MDGKLPYICHKLLKENRQESPNLLSKFALPVPLFLLQSNPFSFQAFIAGTREPHLFRGDDHDYVLGPAPLPLPAS